ncbi:MAG: methyltransferase domain-containing protein [Defluviitaleaceae bacterium]|nr:methyltransferase domain-containing protein [Defluviitaleaceae bacterium]
MKKFEKLSRAKYDKKAPKYDRTIDGHYCARFKRKLVETISVSDGEKVLDVGCGNGTLIGWISQKAKIQAFGVDISAKMIDECRVRHPHIDFNVSLADSLPFGDNEFDVITMCCVLHHLDEPQKFFPEVKRVLKPGGRLIISDPWYPPPFKQFAEYVVFPIHNAGDNKLFTRTQFKNFFTENGFSVLNTYYRGDVQTIIGLAPSAPGMYSERP